MRLYYLLKGHYIETDAENETGLTKDDVQRVTSLVKDVDIEELRSDIVLQVEAELFQGNTMLLSGTSMTLE